MTLQLAAKARTGPREPGEHPRLVTIRIGYDEEELTWDQWEQRVRAGRIPPSTLVRFEPVTGEDFVPANELDLFHSMSEESRRDWADRYRSGAPPWMTALLAGAQIQLWWILATGRAGGDPAVAPTMYRISEGFRLWNPSILEDGEVWRVLSAGVFHEDLLHIGSNLVMLIYVGWHLERALGRLNLLTIFTLSVVGGSLASMFLTPDTPSIGASGGVLGVVAAATVFGFVRHGLLSDRARIIFGWALLPYLVLIYGMGWYNPGTDNWAHTGGLVTGGVLALLYDPPGLERAKGWGVTTLAVSWGAVVAILGGLWLAGPRLIGIEDVHAHSAGLLAPRKHRELTWSRPATWERRSVFGAPGFASRADPTRAWAVRVRNNDRPLDAAEEVANLGQEVAAEWGADATTVRGVEPAKLAGLDGARIRVEVAGDKPFAVERIAVTRGHQLLEATWAADRDREAALASLRDRLTASVVWDVPESLLRARDAVDRKPHSRAPRRTLADELMLVGRTDEAVAIWRDLVEERPTQADGWLGLLRIARSDPTHVGDIEAVCGEALSATDLPQVAAEVALTLDGAGKPDLARGLTEIAWQYAPGDRHLRRARKSFGQTTLLQGIEPAQARRDPMTGALLDRLLRPTATPPWSLDQAATVGAELAGVRTALGEQAVAEPGLRSLAPLLLLQLGVLPEPESLADAVDGIIEDLRSAHGGNPPHWMPPRVVAWAQVAADPDFVQSLQERAAPPAETLDDADPGDVDAWLASLGLLRIDTPDGVVTQRG